jgi:hypothetical protein
VRAIVEAHGGTVAARSVPGRGSTFAITLPGFDSHPPETESAAPAREEKAAVGAPQPGPDDQPD